jgi:hypothetical protein
VRTSGTLAFKVKQLSRQEMVVSLPTDKLKHDCADNLTVVIESNNKITPKVFFILVGMNKIMVFKVGQKMLQKGTNERMGNHTNSNCTQTGKW